MKIKKRVVIALTIEGTEEQANCVCDAIGQPLGQFVEDILTPLSHSEEINVSWDIGRERWTPDVMTK